MPNIFAISDLHLSNQVNKPMDKFGSNWNNHFEKIKKDWIEKVNNDDIVVIAGDISWAMALEEAIIDLKEIDSLPGTKIMIRGNHDYWWSSLKKINSLNFNTIKFIQNNAVKIDKYIFAGVRGWEIGLEHENNEHIYERELERLKLSVTDAKKKYIDGDIIIGITHYPPYNEFFKPSIFTEFFKENNIKTIIYGHLHNLNPDSYPQFYIIDGCKYILTSCDYLDFKLLKIDI